MSNLYSLLLAKRLVPLGRALVGKHLLSSYAVAMADVTADGIRLTLREMSRRDAIILRNYIYRQTDLRRPIYPFASMTFD